MTHDRRRRERTRPSGPVRTSDRPSVPRGGARETSRAERDPNARRLGGRSARVVQSVTEAALEVLSERGYAGLSVEEVARRAGVNKTTVYRRWPTRFDLAQAALLSFDERDPGGTDTGDVERDLVAYFGRSFGRMTSAKRALARLFFAGEMEAELLEVVARVRKKRIEDIRRILTRGIANGQLPATTSMDLLLEILVGTFVYARLRAETVSPKRVARTVAFVLAGARAEGSRSSR